MAFRGAGTWQLKSDCGGIYRKHIRVTFFNWEEENCLRRFWLRWIHLPALTFSVSSKWGQFVNLGLDWKMIIENICFICDIIRLGRTYKAVSIISWGPLRQDRETQKSLMKVQIPLSSSSLVQSLTQLPPVIIWEHFRQIRKWWSVFTQVRPEHFHICVLDCQTCQINMMCVFSLRCLALPKVSPSQSCGVKGGISGDLAARP